MGPSTKSLGSYRGTDGPPPIQFMGIEETGGPYIYGPPERESGKASVGMSWAPSGNWWAASTKSLGPERESGRPPWGHRGSPSGNWFAPVGISWAPIGKLVGRTHKIYYFGYGPPVGNVLGPHRETGGAQSTKSLAPRGNLVGSPWECRGLHRKIDGPRAQNGCIMVGPHRNVVGPIAKLVGPTQGAYGPPEGIWWPPWEYRRPRRETGRAPLTKNMILGGAL